MTEKQLTKPLEQSLSLDVFPANTDAGTGNKISRQAAISLIRWSQSYGFDPWAGHTALMYGRPYITEKGALARAQRDKRYRGYALGRIPKGSLPDYDYPKEARGWFCEVYVEGFNQPVWDIGVVTDVEIAEVEAKHGDKARYLPLWRDPSGMAKVRAIRRAHLRAFPLQGHATEDLEEPTPEPELLTGDAEGLTPGED